jgi:nucleotide-binding universal stress UspA family protein
MAPPVIAHATDLSGDDQSAFHHACALAAASGARLVTVHASAAPIDPGSLPDAAALAARWSRAIEHVRVDHQCCDDAADTVIDAICRIAPDLVVTGSHGRRGLAALLAGSVAEAVARNVVALTLIVPNRVRGFIDTETGAIDLARILVAAGDAAETAVGMNAARAFAALAGAPDAEIISVHVDAARVADGIVAAARDRSACLIAMATRGHDGLADVLRGSHTEQVLRDAGCPVLSVPLSRPAR